MMRAMKTVTMVMCLFAVLHLVSSQDMDMDELPGFEKIVEHTKATFVEEAKTDVTLALKNAMAKFAEEFSEYARKNEHEPEEVAKGIIYRFMAELLREVDEKMGGEAAHKILESVCKAGKFPFPEEFVINHHKLIKAISTTLPEVCPDPHDEL